MTSEEEQEIPVAETPMEETAATIAGAFVGELDGLIWEDATGVDVVSVTTDAGQVAVPVDHGEWRVGGVVELEYDEEKVKGAPLLSHLQEVSANEAIEQVAEHYSLNLGGPPPGPDPQPLPPWWPTGDARD